MEKALKKITVTTHPNGYTLEFDGHEFMYFNEMDLLAGFIARVGGGNTKEMEKGSLLNAMFDVMLGEKYAQDVTRLNDTVAKLEVKYADRINRLERQISILDDAQEKHEAVMKNVKNLTEMVHKLMEGYGEACKPYDEYRLRIDKLDKDTSRIESHFKAATAQSESLLKNIGETLERVNNTEAYLSSQTQVLVFKLKKMAEGDTTQTFNGKDEEKPAESDDEGVAGINKTGHKKSATGKKNAAGYERRKAKKADDDGETKPKRNSSRKNGDEAIRKMMEKNESETI